MEFTESQIEELEAGRELDALIAVHIFNWQQRYARTISGEDTPVANAPEYLFPPDTHYIHDEPERVPDYSTTWEGAGMVLDALHKEGWEVSIHMTQDDYFLNECLISKPGWREEDRLYGRSNSLFVAICRAAIKAVSLV